MPMDTTLVVALAEFWPTANTSRLPPWTRPLASARTPPATVAVGIITEMLIAPPLPPFDSAAALFFPVAETLTAPLDVTEPPLVISAVTSAALVTWASDDAPPASDWARATFGPVAVTVTAPETAIGPPETAAVTSAFWPMSASDAAAAPDRSEERRVGKECRSRWW